MENAPNGSTRGLGLVSCNHFTVASRHADTPVSVRQLAISFNISKYYRAGDFPAIRHEPDEVSAMTPCKSRLALNKLNDCVYRARFLLRMLISSQPRRGSKISLLHRQAATRRNLERLVFQISTIHVSAMHITEVAQMLEGG
jgi:hypothetical protein